MDCSSCGRVVFPLEHMADPFPASSCDQGVQVFLVAQVKQFLVGDFFLSQKILGIFLRLGVWDANSLDIMAMVHLQCHLVIKVHMSSWLLRWWGTLLAIFFSARFCGFS